MTNAEEQLATIGFGTSRREISCWRTVRLDAPEAATQRTQTGPAPECSRALRHWRDVLARGARPSPYRISRIDRAGRA